MDIPDRLNHAQAHEQRLRLKVLVDGVECRSVREYCISEGWIERIARDETGKMRHDGDEIVTERLTGIVKVELVE